jgi:hypothetical protein
VTVPPGIIPCTDATILDGDPTGPRSCPATGLLSFLLMVRPGP